jgi:hypothetical protein
MSVMHRRTRQLAIAVSVVGVLSSMVLGSSTAFAKVTHATVTHTKGSPQPELKPYNIGTKPDGEPGSIGVLPNGKLLVAFDVTTADDRGATKVCILNRVHHACAADSPTIVPPAGGSNDTSDPNIFVTSSKDVYLLLNDVTTGDELYTSTDGGTSFGTTPINLGTSADSPAEAVLAGDNLVWARSQEDAEVSTVPLSGSPTPGEPVTFAKPEPIQNGLATYKNGVLAIDGSFDGNVYATYAAAGKSFASSASFVPVGTFTHEVFEAADGDALITQRTTGKEQTVLRIFNGTKYGAPHVIPHSFASGPQSFSVSAGSSGEIHVFTVLAAAYNLVETSTTNGTSWTSSQTLSNATVSNDMTPGLDAAGSGIVLGIGISAGGTDRAYPVLARQSVSFALNHTKVKRTHLVKISGKATAAKKGRVITLEVLGKHNVWSSLAATTESASGKFRFTLRATKVGSFTYRAVADDSAGFVQFGYSPPRRLTVKK